MQNEVTAFEHLHTQITDRLEQMQTLFATSQASANEVMADAQQKITTMHQKFATLDNWIVDLQRTVTEKNVKIWNSFDELRNYFEQLKREVYGITLSQKSKMQEFEDRLEHKMKDMDSNVTVLVSDIGKTIDMQVAKFKKEVADSDAQIQSRMKELTREKENIQKKFLEQFDVIKGAIQELVKNRVKEYTDSRMNTFFQSDTFQQIQQIELKKAVNMHFDSTIKQSELQDLQIKSIRKQLDTTQSYMASQFQEQRKELEETIHNLANMKDDLVDSQNKSSEEIRAIMMSKLAEQTVDTQEIAKQTELLLQSRFSQVFHFVHLQWSRLSNTFIM